MTITKTTNTQNNTTSSSRRKALKLAAGGGLVSGAAFTSGTWTKPMINAVLLPAHAQTSMVEASTFGGSATTVAGTQGLDQKSILDLFVTPVNAGEEVDVRSIVDTIDAYAVQTGDDSFDFQFLITTFPQQCSIISKGEFEVQEIQAMPGPEDGPLSAFIEVSASGGMGQINKLSICDGALFISAVFEYTVGEGSIDIVLSTSGPSEFSLSNFPLTLMPGGSPLTDPGCVVCEDIFDVA